MKILIIGKNSFIGNHIDEWLKKAGHHVEQIDVLNDGWKVFDYSSYNAIVHVAGIVHQPKCQDWELYKRVNTDMPVAIATLAKKQGVRQYVFFSTMGVYGVGKKLRPNVIDGNTPLPTNDNSMYGKSKLLAEIGLKGLEDEDFRIALVRPPSVYGKGCRGGYITGFTKIVKMLPVIPRVYLDARQSFIYIDNLCECIRLIVENKLGGVFCPQDDEIPNANRLLKVISEGIGKKYRTSSFLGWCLHFVSFIPLVKKAYGGISYARDLSEMPNLNYVITPFEEGMKKTVS
jgi:UDP-glucose 4-epimerase